MAKLRISRKELLGLFVLLALAASARNRFTTKDTTAVQPAADDAELTWYEDFLNMPSSGTLLLCPGFLPLDYLLIFFVYLHFCSPFPRLQMVGPSGRIRISKTVFLGGRNVFFCLRSIFGKQTFGLPMSQF